MCVIATVLLHLTRQAERHSGVSHQKIYYSARQCQVWGLWDLQPMVADMFTWSAMLCECHYTTINGVNEMGVLNLSTAWEPANGISLPWGPLVWYQFDRQVVTDALLTKMTR